MHVSATTTRDPRASIVAWAAVLVGLAFLAYAPALRSGWIWDDDAYVTANPTLRTGAGLVSIWLDPTASRQYYPITFTSLWLDHQLWGNEPFGYHLVNVLLHAASALVLWHILLRLDAPFPWVVAALFALHPLHVESVAWVTERKNILSGFLYLTAAAAYLRCDDDRTASRAVWYGVSLGVFAAALMAKTVTCSLPAALLLVAWWKKGRVDAGDVVRLLPFFVIGAAFAWVTVHTEREHVGAAGADWALSAGQRILIAGRALWFYAGKLIRPHPLTFIYPRWDVDTGSPLQWAYPTSAVSVIVALFLLRNRIGRGPLCAVLFFAGSLVPALGFVDVYPMRFSFVADHFCYLASIGLLALFAAAAALVVRAPRVRLGVAAVVLAVCIGLVWTRTGAYADSPALWRDTIARNPSAWIAYNNLGADLLAEGRLDEAAANFETALRLKPDLDDALNNLGVIAQQQQRKADALRYFSDAVRITPGFAPALVNLGDALIQHGRVDEAIERYRQALNARPIDYRLLPALPAVHTNLGYALSLTGDTAGAIGEYRAALELSPSFAPAQQQLDKLQR